ncbi:MAG: ankyrin repeat domain-containing protein [Spirochaetia bacterium]|nr:ankyrin repeat domain-containing protein [Spirochaetia bacterium]
MIEPTPEPKIETAFDAEGEEVFAAPEPWIGEAEERETPTSADRSEKTEKTERGGITLDKALKRFGTIPKDFSLNVEKAPAIDPFSPVGSKPPDELAEDPEEEEVKEPEEVIIEEPPEPLTLFEAVDQGKLDIIKERILMDGVDIQSQDEQGRTPLHRAALKGSFEMVYLLIKYGADPNVRDKAGNLPIHLTIPGDFSLAYELTDRGKLIYAADPQGNIPLEEAFAAGPDALHKLLQDRYVNIRDEEGNTPLHYAAEYGDTASIRQLIKDTANVNLRNYQDELPLDIAFTYRESRNHVDAVELLIDAYSDVPRDPEFYYAYQAISNDDVRSRFENGATVLHAAAAYNHPALLRLFIQSGAYLEARDEHNNTPLHSAVKGKNISIVKTLVESGARIDARNSSYNTPLHCAVLSSLSSDESLNPNSDENADGNADGNSDGNTAKKADENTVKNSETAPVSIRIAEFLLEEGADVTALNNKSRTPLHESAVQGIPETFTKMLIEHGSALDAKDRNGDTPLMISLAEKNIDVMNLLLDAGAGIFVRNNQRVNPVIRALLQSTESAKIFLRKDMLDRRDSDYNTPLHIAVQIKSSLPVIQHLTDMGASMTAENMIGNTPLHTAVSTEYVKAAAYLIERGSSPFTENNRGESALLLAYRKGVRITREILTPEIIRSSGGSGETPLHIAAKEAFTDVSEFLIQEGAPVNARDESGASPLHESTRIDHVEISRMLINSGAEVNLQDNYGNTPLHTAVSRSANRVAKLLLFTNANLHVRNLSGNSLLHTAVLNNNQEAVKMLIPFGANLEARDNTGLTPLLLAAKKNQNAIARELIVNGADAQARDNRGNTPLHEAVKNKNEYISLELIDSGADIYAENRFEESPLTTAISFGMEVMDWFITQRTVAARSDSGNSPLHTAVQHNASEEVIHLLLDRGADIDGRNNKIESPLHVALRASNKRAVKTLTAAGADIFLRNGEGESPVSLAMGMGRDVYSWIVDTRNMHAQDRNGNTPLHLAVSRGYPDIVQYLLSIGADPKRTNIMGQSAVDLAQTRSDDTLRTLLR